MDGSYDYVVLGGGSGGMASARRAATYGAKVLVIERGRDGGAGLGGTCVHYGCVPKKVMFNTAMHAEIMHSAKDYLFKNVKEIQFGDFDWSAMKVKRDAYIERLNGIYERNLKNAQVDLVNGVAKFVDAKTVEVNGKKYTGKHILIAVGGAPALPVIPGIEHTITSDGFFHLQEQPKKVAVVGAGYIAVELAGIFNALKSETTLFCRFGQVLRAFDPIVRDLVNEEMERLAEFTTYEYVICIHLSEPYMYISLELVSNLFDKVESLPLSKKAMVL